MSKQNLQTCKSGKDFLQYCERQDVNIRNGKGSHFVVSNDKGAVVIPCHNDDLGKGLRAKIIKGLLAIGLSVSLLCVVASML